MGRGNLESSYLGNRLGHVMVYLDYNATTPLDSRVRERITLVDKEVFANPASLQHAAGRRASEWVEASRQAAGDALGLSATHITWTSGATESLFLAILGVAGGAPEGRRNIVISSTEHKAAIAAAHLARQLFGSEIRWIEPSSQGEINMDSLVALLDPTVCLLVVMHSNNETGVINPVEMIAGIARELEIPVLSDCTQSLGKTELQPTFQAADLFALSLHKAYGPKGVGLLAVESKVRKRMMQMTAGGGQESGFRGGTQDVSRIAGAALALELAIQERSENTRLTMKATDDLWSRLTNGLEDVELVTGNAARLSNTLNLRFRGADAEAVMAHCPDLAVSTGSACNSAMPEPSHVLLAMGLDRSAAEECIRFSVGRQTTSAEIEFAADAVISAVTRVRQLTAA